MLDNLSTLLQLVHTFTTFHTCTLQLAQLLVTKTIGSETMGNSQLDPLNTDHKQLLLELSCILGEQSTSFQNRRVFCILPPVNVRPLQLKTLRRRRCLLRLLQKKTLTWQSCQPQATTNTNTLAVFSGNTNTNTKTVMLSTPGC